MSATTRSAPNRLPLLALVGGVFLCFTCMGALLPVLPVFVRHSLGLGDVAAGASVSLQFVATVCTRGLAGRIADRDGPHRAARRGAVLCALAGGFILAAALPLSPWLRYALLILGRLVHGSGESLLVTGTLAWGIGLTGRPSTVLTWNGMAMYGGLAAGAPAGLWLMQDAGLTGVGAMLVLLPLLALLLTAPVGGVAPPGGRRHSFWTVIGLIWRPGAGVALQGVGIAAIGSFVALDFRAQGWSGAGVALSCFGFAFVAVRVLFGWMPDRLGGAPVALGSLLLEAAGLLILWLAPTQETALLGATLTGCGCSLVFPALGVAAVAAVPPQNRGTALGAYAAFQDVALGVTGPLAGLVVGPFGYPAIFGLAAVAALAGMVTAIMVWRAGRMSPAGA